ncbi:AAC(3) family N-acetyltransferase [Candidatus Poribacteria bacterium]|nr:AAC(3) family N-acetyltransferase [Candidatus Poribacteria bacterium]
MLWALRVRLKEAKDRLIQPIRRRQIKNSQPAISKRRLIDDLHALGIVKDNVVLVHSSLKSLGYVDGGAQTVLEALFETVTPSGTLVIPTYHMLEHSCYNTCLAADKYMFDPRRHGTYLGAIPSAFLKFPNIQRSIHPTHSVSAVGHHAKYVTESHHLAPSTFGPDSPWDRILKLNGKVLGLGVSLAPVAYYHALEDTMKDEFPLPVRVQATYDLRCRDWSGNLVVVRVRPLDPHYVKQRIDQKEREDLRAYFWQEFRAAGLLTTGKIGSASSWQTQARGFFDHLVRLMREGITIYSTPEELSRRPLSGRN